MDSFRTGLKVEDGKLFGRRLFHPDWALIAPADIRKVREYGFNNPFVRIWTTHGKFTVGAMREQYDAVTEYLKQNTPFDLEGAFVHHFNVAFYRTPVGPTAGRILQRLMWWRKSG